VRKVKIEIAERTMNDAREKFIQRCGSALFALAVQATYSTLLTKNASKDREGFLLDVSYRHERETPSKFARWYYSLPDYIGPRFFNEDVFDDFLESILAFIALTELNKIDGRSKIGRRVSARFA
jgi:hypothetical protein